MKETPNLLYIIEIAGEDHDFAKRFINLLKEEFRWEVGMYLRHIDRLEPRQAAEIVAKAKYKLSILGLQKSFDFANQYERHLRNGDTSLDEKFRKILENVNAFLMKVKSA